MHAPEGYGIRSVCVFVCVCARVRGCVSVPVSVTGHASCYIPHLYKVLLGFRVRVRVGFLWRSPRMNCVDFLENALFKSSGDILTISAFFAS